jgi:phage-related protein
VDGRRAKELYFVRDSKKALRLMPEEVKDAFGQALLELQFGDTPTIATRSAKGCQPRCGSKKSKAGRATPQSDRDLVTIRMRDAVEHHHELQKSGGAE